MSYFSHFLTLYYRPLSLNSTIIHHNSTGVSQQGFRYIFTTIISQKAPRSGHLSSRYNWGQHLSKVLAPINYIPSSSKRTQASHSPPLILNTQALVSRFRKPSCRYNWFAATLWGREKKIRALLIAGPLSIFIH